MKENFNYCKLGKITAVCFQNTNYEDKVELQLGDQYEIKEENGKHYAVKKSKYTTEEKTELAKELLESRLNELNTLRNSGTLAQVVVFIAKVVIYIEYKINQKL